jgi:large subunit ribosomal protein L22
VQTKAQAKFVRVSARKARLVTDLIRGKDVAEAQQTLDYCEKGAARIVSKVLNSAAANAENNHGLNADTLFVYNAYVDEGPTLKRFRPRAMGRATRINKRTSHITVILEEREPEKAKPKRSFRRQMGKGAKRKAAERAAAAEEAEMEAAKAEETTEELAEEEELAAELDVGIEEGGAASDLEDEEEEAEEAEEEPAEEVEGEEEPAEGEPEETASESSESKSPAEDAGTGEE